MIFDGLLDFYILNVKEHILITSAKDPYSAWRIFDKTIEPLADREDYAILNSWSIDVTDYCEKISKELIL